MGRRTGSRIILIGFSTTGKSEVGRQVADYLGWELIDTDEDIVRLSGKSIDEIFAQDGEEHFRQIERQVLSGACARERAVISAGGG
ncbi:MAG: shikimate kinase, partial [Chloroflexi bacterium]|nr:shikimate kinase [Chloroflexota bacterium]